jgi:MoxR-like ATPase
MKIVVTFPTHAELSRIVERTIAREEATVSAVLDRADILDIRSVCHDILIAPHVQDYAVQLVMATQPDQREAHADTKRYVRYGSSPRGAQSLVECGRVLALMRGRLHLSIDDIKEVAPSVLRHRIILNFDAHADGKTPDAIIASIISGVAVQAAA